MGVIPYILYYSCLGFFFFHLIGNQSLSCYYIEANLTRFLWLHRIPGFVCVGPSIVPLICIPVVSPASWSYGENTLVCAFVYLLVWTDSETWIWYFLSRPLKAIIFTCQDKELRGHDSSAFPHPTAPLWAASLVLSAISEVGRMHFFF